MVSPQVADYVQLVVEMRMMKKGTVGSTVTSSRIQFKLE